MACADTNKEVSQNAEYTFHEITVEFDKGARIMNTPTLFIERRIIKYGSVLKVYLNSI